MENNTLTLKEERFVQAYVQTGNATEAVIQAGYDVRDRETARYIGYRNTTKDHIKKAIEDETNMFAQRLNDEANHLLDILLEMAYSKDVPSGIRVRVITDLLDRAGYTAKKLVSTDVNVLTETRYSLEIAKRARDMMVDRLGMAK